MQDKDIFPTGPMELPGEPSQGPSPAPQKHHNFARKKWLLIIASLLVIGLLGLFAWRFINNRSSPAAENKDRAATPEKAPVSNQLATDVPQATETKTFKADHPRVEFAYPASWTTESTADSGVLVKSPDFSVPLAGGGETLGHFRIYIRQGARAIDSPYIGSGKAIKPSETLIYSQPAPGQRSETSLTEFGYNTQDHFAYFFIAGNYSLQSGETLGPDYGKESETYIIAAGYSSADLTDDLAMQRVALDYYSTTRAYQQALNIIKSLKVL